MQQSTLSRRDFIAILAVAALAGRPALASDETDVAPTLGEAAPFTPDIVRDRARILAAAEYEAPPEGLPDGFGDLSHDAYRAIRYRNEASLWQGEALRYRLRFLPRGGVFRTPVAINVVEDGTSRPLHFSPDLFNANALSEGATLPPDLGFSGFAVHTPLNRVDRHEEMLVFHGASYFRAIAAGQRYGLSARGLAIATGEPEGEEFPAFREFWVERPGTGSAPVVVHALLDSPSTTGAYRFTVRPGNATTIEVSLSLFPRVDLMRVGLAPLTSMFFFGPQDRAGVDDYRVAVHNSDGLLMWNGSDEWIWRPLANPSTLQISAFLDRQPKGFGLMQRRRRLADFEDIAAGYHQRPSAWLEPVGDWGEGSVILFEIPTDSEVNDNVTCFWRPHTPLAAGYEYDYAYRLHWADRNPVKSGLARIERTLIGSGSLPGSAEQRPSRMIAIDYAGGALADPAALDGLDVDVQASSGTVNAPAVHHNPEIGGCRVAFEYVPEDAESADLRCALRRGDERVAEIWVFRWSN